MGLQDTQKNNKSEKPEPHRSSPVSSSETTSMSRRTALIIMGSILNARQPMDTVMDINPDFRQLDMRDRGFVRMLVTTTLRRLGEIDTIIKKTQDKPDQTLQPVLKNILRLGVAQIMFLDVPDHAAVDTSVRLAESQGLAKFKGLVNGILRNVTRHHHEWSQEYDPARINIPDWLFEKWEDDYGHETALNIAQASLCEAPLDLTVKNPDRIDQIAESLGGEKLWNGTVRINASGQIQDLAGYQDGTWWVQNISAALPVLFFGDVANREVIDLCAAPGGKTAQLAARGAYVHSLDRSARRLNRFMENMQRLRLDENVSPVSADASVWHPKNPVDGVLLDAPCTATGTLRRNPDILHLKSERDVRKMMNVQHTLIKNAASMVKPGGMLIYCTCSLQKEEGEDQIDWFLNSVSDFRRVPINPEEVSGHDYLINDRGDIRILPNMMEEQGGMDGFFIARLVRL